MKPEYTTLKNAILQRPALGCLVEFDYTIQGMAKNMPEQLDGLIE